MARRFVRQVENVSSEDEDRARKVGFEISTENDFKLTVYARKHHKSRSSVVNDCLSQLLRGVVISFRNNSSEAGEAA